MRARDLMCSEPYVVAAADPVARAAELMRDMDVGALPVVSDPYSMRLLGVITDRDVAVRCVAYRHRGDCTVRDHMTGGHLETVEPDAPLEEVMARMRDGRVRRVLVTEGERLVGVVSLADVARHAGSSVPLKVEWLLERLSEPAFDLSFA